MKDLGKLILVLAIGVAIGYFLIPREKEIVRETVTVEIEVPAKTGEFEPIENPTPITITNTEYIVDEALVDEYKKANDSLKAELFKSAVVVREYEETFEDSVQTIKVKANVTGILNSLSASYVTKPFTVKKDTVVEFKVPANKKSISLYLEVGLPTIQDISSTPVLKAGFDFKNKKNMIYGASFDTEKHVWFKVGKTFNF
jgi:hypothetical protein